MKKRTRKITKQHIILLVVILFGVAIGVIAGITYKNTQKEQGISVSISNYAITDAKPASPSVADTADVKAHIITVAIENNSNTTFNLLPSEYFRLLIDDASYTLSPDMAIQNPLPGGEIAVSTSNDGEISFHVPSNQQGELQFRTSINSSWVTISK